MRWAVLLLFGTLAGCFRVSAVDRKPAAPERDRSYQHFFILGAVGHYEVDVREVCRGSDATVTTGGDPLTIALAVLTAGLYFPRVTTVKCTEPSATSAAPKAAP